MREPSSIMVYKLDFRSSGERIKSYLDSKGKDSWDSYYPMGNFGYLEIPSVSSNSLHDMYVLDSFGVGSNKPITDDNPLTVPFHGESGNLLKGTYSFSREPVIQSRYFGGISSFFIEEVTSLHDFILSGCEETYKAWSTFIVQISR